MELFQPDRRVHPKSTKLKIVPGTNHSEHPIHQELKDIFRKALHADSEPERDRLRRQGLRKMLAAPKECFWQGNSGESLDPERYIKASDIAWDYIERKIYGNVRGKRTAEEKAYDPDKGNASPIALWNTRCKNEYRNLHKNPQQITPPNPIDPRTGESWNIEDVAQAEETTPLLERVRQEIETDPTGELTHSCIRKNPPPPITVQAALLVIYDRVSRGEKWTCKILAEHFHLSPGTMNAAWNRTVLPLLKKMGDRLTETM